MGLNGKRLHYLLQLWYSPTALLLDAPIDLLIYHMIVGLEAKQRHRIALVLKFSAPRGCGYLFASLNDLPDLAAYFLTSKFE
ncbi:hypothetical protein SCLCIDRAFT_133479 [Scleroderma citrinum Foug A]|uniref:Uncharacterized protein n=1 Tax=Scleroderma citrinum Foug A TaxID=1036808 RepID=A0A0C2Z2D4_9AGAM|nr:hypothetical protein SCLCIDRAFT_133479 [Scleroderma citrinum Foug A]